MPIWPSPLHSLVSKENINMCSSWNNEFVQCTIEFVHYISVQHVIQAHSISFQWTLTRWVWQTMPTRSACYLTFNPSSTSSRLEGKKFIFLHECNWHEISIVQFSIYNGIRNPSCVSHLGNHHSHWLSICWHFNWVWQESEANPNNNVMMRRTGLSIRNSSNHPHTIIITITVSVA